MPSLAELLNNLPNFKYYGGYGQFNSKSIPFGKDQPGGGSSGQPFIVRSEGEKWNPTPVDDGTMPLGIIGSTNRSLADVERITKFFDTPKGLLFLSKQEGLQMSNPMLELPASNTPASSTVGQVVSKLNDTFGPTRIFNLGVNTLAEIGTVAFGEHFDRHGLSPSMDPTQKYISVVQNNNTADLNETINKSAGNRLVETTAELFDSTDLVVNSYIGGPGSVYGIGQTVIKRTVDTIGDNAINQQKINNFTPLKISDLAKIGRDGTMIISSGNPNASSFNVKTQDFRQLKNTLYNAGLQSSDYISNNIETRIGRGDPGRPGLDRSNYTASLQGTQDLINKLSLFYAANPPGTDSQIYDLNSGQIINAPQIRDIVKFRIEAIDNDNPAYSIWMVFRATIIDFNDNTDSEWNAYKYNGRGEYFKIYSVTTSEYSFTFKIAAQSRDEMKPLYQKLNYLKSNMWGDYSGNNKMRGPITKLTIGDYIYRQPGIITSLNIHVPNEARWEIALNEPEGGADANMHEVPMVLEVSMNFQPIYDFLPRKGASTPFISVNGRKSPSDPLSPPSPNNWLADNGTANNSDGTVRYTPLEQKIGQVRKQSLNG